MMVRLRVEREMEARDGWKKEERLDWDS